MPITDEHKLSLGFPCYYDLYEPESPRALLVALHGYGGNKDSMLRLAKQVNSQDFAIASIQGPHQHVIAPDRDSRPTGYGFGWITSFQPEESIRLHHQLVSHVIEEHANGLPIFLVGFSQSVALNFRFVFSNPNLVRGAIAICGGIPGDWDEGGYEQSQTDVLYLHGTTDRIYPPTTVNENAVSLRKRAAAVDVQEFSIGHMVTRQMLPVINEWILDRTS